MSDAALTFAGVTKRYGAVVALDSVSVAIDRGEMFGLIGPDGAGKTTAIRLACGLARPDAGSIRILGHDPARARREVTDRVGYLSQRFSLYGDLTIDENIAFFAEIHGVRRYGPARDRLLDMTQLTPFRGRRAIACRGDEAEARPGLHARARAGRPAARRADDGRGPGVAARVLEAALGVPAARPHHRHGDAVPGRGRALQPHRAAARGRLLATAPPAALQARAAGPLLEVVTEGRRPPVDLLAPIPGVVDVQPFGDRVHARLAGPPLEPVVDAMHGALARAGVRVLSIRPIPPSLEDIFIELIAEAS
jgi:ABC-2 type transport system ATP-binding protein